MTYSPRQVVDGMPSMDVALAPEPVLLVPKPDGRRLRAERTRAAIIDALHALIEEGDLKPTAPRIAQRAQVSLRTIFQHFAEVEHLFAALAEQQVERITAMTQRVDASLPLTVRVDVYAEQRARVLEEVTPVARAGAMQEPFSARVHAQSNRLRVLAHEEVVHTFGPELDSLPAARRAVLLAALRACSTWRMWQILRAEQGLDTDDARQVFVFQLRSVLAAQGFEGLTVT